MNPTGQVNIDPVALYRKVKNKLESCVKEDPDKEVTAWLNGICQNPGGSHLPLPPGIPGLLNINLQQLENATTWAFERLTKERVEQVANDRIHRSRAKRLSGIKALGEKKCWNAANALRHWMKQ